MDISLRIISSRVNSESELFANGSKENWEGGRVEQHCGGRGGGGNTVVRHGSPTSLLRPFHRRLASNLHQRANRANLNNGRCTMELKIQGRAAAGLVLLAHSWTSFTTMFQGASWFQKVHFRKKRVAFAQHRHFVFEVVETFPLDPFCEKLINNGIFFESWIRVSNIVEGIRLIKLWVDVPMSLFYYAGSKHKPIHKWIRDTNRTYKFNGKFER